MKSGDFVYINSLENHKKHFPQQKFGFLDYTYHDKYGGNVGNKEMWCVNFKDKYTTQFNHSVAWYDSNEMVVIITYEI